MKLASELYRKDTGNTLYILDEPTTGLHFEDIKVLLGVLQKLVDNGNSVVEQVEKQLNKLVEVIKVRTLDESSLIGRELLLIKVSANKNSREQIMTICNICGAKVADISPTSMTMELSDTPDRIDTFEDMMRPFNILEVARTGVIALQRGGGKI